MLHPNELIVDNFAGGGGASCGIEMAFSRSPDVAINHDPEAIAMHKANHPNTEHFCKSIYVVDPDDIIRKYKRRIGFAWFSPDCTHHSKARGGKPKQKHIRDLAWVVVHWAERGVYKGERPRVICVENVEEFRDWGPLLEDGQPCPVQKGFEFKKWVRALEKLGYKVEHKILRACDYGAPTIRKRLVVIARCDGQPIIWPAVTHGPGHALAYRTAAECIDWSIPCPSIFERKKPLAENTLRRIARGIQRFVIDSPKPFIIKVNHTYDQFRGQSIDDPLQTVTGQNGYGLVTPFVSTYYGDKRPTDVRGAAMDSQLPTQTTENRHALVSPILVGAGGPAYTGKPRTTDAPMHTQTNENHSALVTAFLAQHNTQRGGINPGRAATDPLSTVTSTGAQQGVVTAFLSQHNGQSVGAPLDAPHPTVMGKQKHSVVASSLVKLKGTCKDGQPVTEPLATVQAQGLHYGEVRAFLLKYYGTEQDPRLEEPMHTVTSKHRFGLVTVHGEEYYIADIGMRMLAPRELYRAQGFPDSYIIDPEYNGKPLTKTAQVRMCGNSVCPPMAQAVAAAQFLPAGKRAAA